MRLRSKLFAIFLLVLVVYIAFHYLLQRRLIIPTLLAMEKDQATAELQRGLAKLQREIQHLERFTNAWVARNDTYDFIQSRDHGYVLANLGVQTFVDNRLDCIVFADTQGRIVWSGDFDRATATLRAVPGFDILPLTGGNGPSVKQGSAQSLCGIAVTPHGPMMVAAGAIPTGKHGSPEGGTLIMGRRLTPELLADFVAQPRLPYEIWSLDSRDLPSAAKQALARIPDDAPLFLPEEDQVLAAYTTLADITGRPALLVKARVSRPIFTKALAAERISLASDLALGAILLVILGAAVHFIVIKPLAHLTRQAVDIRETNELILRSELGGADEVGRLAQEFNRLLDRLQKTREELERRVVARTTELRAAKNWLEGEICERKRAEASLREARDRLEEMVAERTEELVAVNTHLQRAIEKQRERDRKLHAYHLCLRRLSSKLILAEERERRRIATMLHDHIGQTLTVAKLNIDALTASQSEAAAQCGIISEQLADTIRAVRTLTFEISPPILYDFGLEAALVWLTEQVQAQHGLKITFEDDGQPAPLDDAQRVLLFQAGRELLFNIVKHAGARHAKVLVRHTKRHIRLVFEDDGRGVDTAEMQRNSHRNGSFGFFSIRERLRGMGGQIMIKSRPGQGTRITIVAPLKEAPSPAIEGQTA